MTSSQRDGRPLYKVTVNQLTFLAQLLMPKWTIHHIHIFLSMLLYRSTTVNLQIWKILHTRYWYEFYSNTEMFYFRPSRVFSILGNVKPDVATILVYRQLVASVPNANGNPVCTFALIAVGGIIPLLCTSSASDIAVGRKWRWHRKTFISKNVQRMRQEMRTCGRKLQTSRHTSSRQTCFERQYIWSI